MTRRLTETPSQTIGPYFAIGLVRKLSPSNAIASEGAAGARIRVHGFVVDGNGDPVDDALIEIWHADAHGCYRGTVSDAFRGFGRCATATDGCFSFDTIKSGQPSAAVGAVHAPHLNVTVFARGMLVHAFTRMYFGDVAANERDDVLLSVDVARRHTLIARAVGSTGDPVYRWDIHLQGPEETVFFDA